LKHFSITVLQMALVAMVVRRAAGSHAQKWQWNIVRCFDVNIKSIWSNRSYILVV